MHLCREARIESEPDLHHHASKSLVEKVAEKLADTEVGPSPVDKKEPLQVAKLGQGVIAALDRLHPFLPADSDSDVRSWREKGEERIREGVEVSLARLGSSRAGERARSEQTRPGVQMSSW